MLNQTDGTIDVVLIDYGFATKFKNDLGLHIKDYEVNKFLGNM